ncbi:MAG: glucosamine-6-phosphate deaminase-like protein [Burkholderiaceae bacterium]|nr:glucosamine-6-phosphate deaminase-like protein [Burkholderiaceae bacterium]
MKPELKTLWQGPVPRALVEGMIPERLRVLVLAPHPDDFDAIGVTLHFLAENGNPIHAAVVQTGSGVEDSYLPGATQAQKAALREKEQRASLRFFGLPEEKLTFLDLERDATDQLKDSAANFGAISAFIIDCQPDIIFLPHGNDTNNAHRVMCSLARQAALRHGRPVALFMNRDAKTVGMRTDLYLPFGDEMAEWKAQLLRFHDSQQQRNLAVRGHGFDERVLMLNRQIAAELKLEARYAEAFELEFYNLG